MMARCLYLPYRNNNPRTIRGAKRRGWTVVKVRNDYSQDVSWMGVNIWCERGMSGYWISSFALREFAFEKSSDAMMFKLKWG